LLARFLARSLNQFFVRIDVDNWRDFRAIFGRFLEILLAHSTQQHARSSSARARARARARERERGLILVLARSLFARCPLAARSLLARCSLAVRSLGSLGWRC